MSDVAGRAVIEVVSDATKFKSGVDEAKRSVKSLGAELGNAVADGSAKASRSLDAYIKKIEVSAATIGMSARETKILELAQRGATSAQLKAADAALGTIEAYKAQQSEARKAAAAAAAGAAIASAAQAAQGKATKLTTFQSQQLSYQLNDLFVQIASGQSPITALIQQGSQLNGTFGGIGGTMRAVGSIFTATRVAIGGIASVFAGLGYAAYEGGKQSADFAKAIALTGNAAGVTEGQFNSLAKSIGDSTKTSVGSARDALQGLVASGRFSGDALGETAKATQLLSKATGQSTDDIVKQFVGMSDGVGKWAETTNKSYHFLTASQLEYIKTLEEQGSEQKAIEVTMGALSSRIEQATKKTNSLGDAWSYVKQEAGKALDQMLSIGRTSTADDQIAQLQQKIEFTNKSAGGLTGMSATALAAFNKGAQAQLAALQATKSAQDDIAKGSERAIAQEQARIKFDTLKEQSLSKQEKMTKELAAANAVADKAGISQVDREKVLANIRDKYKEAKGPASKAPQEAKAFLAYDLDAIKKASAAEIDIYTNADKIMEAKRSANLIDDKRYYAEKMALIQLTSQAQEAALLKEIERMQSEKLVGKDKTDNDRKIMDAQAQLAKVRADASISMQVSTIQEKAAIDKIAKSYMDAKVAAEAYLDTVKKQNAREVEGIGKGQRFREEQGGLSQIEDKQTSERQNLERDKRNKVITQEEFDTYLAIVNDTYTKEVDLYGKRTQDIKALQADGLNGATEAIQNYLDLTANMAAQTEDLVGNAIHGMEDALVNFVMTGKLSFGDLAKSIIADLVRIQAKAAISGVMKMIGSAGGMNSLTGSGTNSLGALNGGGNIVGLASGGPAGAGSLHEVNENGPELLTTGGKTFLMMGSQAGMVTPNHKIAAGGGASVTYSPVINIDSRSDRAAVMQDVQRAVANGNAQLVDQLSRAGRI